MIETADLLGSKTEVRPFPGIQQEAWFALYTKSRHEKILERELMKKGLQTFLPLKKVIRHWSDRK